MANTTIYPYGTGGSLPANIGIINDLSTGGVDKALSAEQGKVIGEAIGGITTPVTVALETGAIYACTYASNFGTANSSETALKMSEAVPCAGYVSLRYPQFYTTYSSYYGYGLVFYDNDDEPIAGYPIKSGTSDARTVEVPSSAAYFKFTYRDASSTVVYLTTASNINKEEPLVNDLGVNFYANFTSTTPNVKFSFNQLNGNAGFYAQCVDSQDSRICLDLTGRDYDKSYKLSLKYNNSGTNGSTYYCVYVTTIRQNGNSGAVFSSASIPTGTGTLTTVIPKNRFDINYIQLSSQSSSGMPTGSTSNIYDLQIEVDDEGGTPGGTPYNGPLVSVEQHYVSAKPVATVTSILSQGGACFGDYLFMFGSSNTTCWIYNLATGTLLQTYTIPSEERGFVSNCHCNTVNFGTEYYDTNDPFPLIYVSTGYSSGGNTGALVYRIIETTESDVTTYSLSLVQTLKMPGDGWTEFVVGGDGDCYLCYTTPRTIYRMKMPTLSQGDVTFDLSEPLDTYQFTPQPSWYNGSRNQNRIFYRGKIYLVSGVPASSEASLFIALDLATRTRVVEIDLKNSLGLSSEPETVFIWNGHFCVFFSQNATVYALIFE